MLLVSSNFSFQVSPAFVIGFLNAKLDRDGMEELGIESDFRISVHAYPENIFLDYLPYLDVPLKYPNEDIKFYVWISNKNRNCEIAVRTDSEFRDGIAKALQVCGPNAVAQIFLMLPMEREDRRGDKIVVSNVQPNITIQGMPKP